MEKSWTECLYKHCKKPGLEQEITGQKVSLYDNIAWHGFIVIQ